MITLLALKSLLDLQTDIGHGKRAALLLSGRGTLPWWILGWCCCSLAPWPPGAAPLWLPPWWSWPPSYQPRPLLHPRFRESCCGPPPRLWPRSSSCVVDLEVLFNSLQIPWIGVGTSTLSSSNLWFRFGLQASLGVFKIGGAPPKIHVREATMDASGTQHMGQLAGGVGWGGPHLQWQSGSKLITDLYFI